MEERRTGIIINSARVTGDNCEKGFETLALLSFWEDSKEVSLTFEAEKDIAAGENLTISFNVRHIFDLLEKIQEGKNE